jgi:hypothetical protein
MGIWAGRQLPVIISWGRPGRTRTAPPLAVRHGCTAVVRLGGGGGGGEEGVWVRDGLNSFSCLVAAALSLEGLLALSLESQVQF